MANHSGSLGLLLLFLLLVGGVPVPEDCLSSEIEGGLRLECSLSAINSPSERTNFSLIPWEHTLTLIVGCTDSSVPSSLEPHGFKSLVHLKHLELLGCSLTSIPSSAFAGLDKLKSLNISTESSEALILSPDAFNGLSSLKELDLSSNRIKEINSKTFCEIRSLETLDLSENELTTLDWTCIGGGSLTSLNVSKNRLTSLSLKYSSFKRLLVQNNAVRHLGPNSLPEKIEELDLSNNNLLSIHQESFKACFALKILGLSSNSLSYLSEDLLTSVNQLESLDLSENSLDSLGRSFLPKISLKTLNLSGNKFSHLDSNVFSGLSSLSQLILSNNGLEDLPNLSELKSLMALHLSKNRLGPFLAKGSFSGLESLSRLSLDSNGLEDLPPGLFKESPKVSVLDLGFNELFEIPTAVLSLPNLQTFSIVNNKLSSLGSLSMPKLWRLQANGNSITNVSSINLKGLDSLQVLDLSHNKISFVQQGSFNKANQLRALRLDFNKLSSIEGLFEDLPNLKWLNVSANSISEFDFYMIPKRLQWLDLHSNRLRSLDNRKSLEEELALFHLDASFNEIEEIGPQSIPNGVGNLILNDNSISQILPYTFFKKTNLRKVELTLNKMESIPSNSIRLSPESIFEAIFYFGGNPIRCDCHMAWFKRINSGSNLQNFPKVADLESIYCQLVYSRKRSFVPLVDASVEDFLCEYESHCFALCHCCDYDACDCEMICPDNCTCYHDDSWTKNIAECSSSNFRGLPDRLPMDATEILLDGNILGELKSHTFIGRKNLKRLFLNDSRISILPNNTFNGLGTLEELHLEDNSLVRLDSEAFSGLDRLSLLYLHDNLLRFISNSTFSSLKKLEILTLHGNRLITFPIWEFQSNPLMNALSLAENEWNCDCSYIKPFQRWLVSFRGSLLGGTELSCSNGTPILSLECQSKSTHLQSLDLPRESDEGPSFFTGLIVASVVVFILLLTLGLLGMYRYEAKVWLYSKYGVRFFHRVNEEDLALQNTKSMDAFFAYSVSDDMFVRQVLAPELEHGPSRYKICLLYRDLHLLTPVYVSDSIYRASEASRRTVLILSENFIKSEWSRYDYKSGLHSALRAYKNPAHLVIILLGNISLKDLDPDLRLYFNTSVVIKWGDKLFWDKLKYSLPDPEEFGDGEHERIRRSSTYSFNQYESCQQSETSTRTMTIHI